MNHKTQKNKIILGYVLKVIFTYAYISCECLQVCVFRKI